MSKVGVLRMLGCCRSSPGIAFRRAYIGTSLLPSATEANATSAKNRNRRLWTTAAHTGHNGESGSTAQWWKYAAAFSASAAIGLTIYQNYSKTQCKESEPTVEGGKRKPNLPDFRRDDVLKHKTKESGIWVTYKEGVYDITEFVEGHPGGNKILLAAGGQLEPFWEMYAVHKSNFVYETMEQYRIGNIHPDDMKNLPKRDSNDPYSADPMRHPALQINSEKPFNAEPPAELLVDNFITPNEIFFVRNHLPVPKIDIKNFKLEIAGVGLKRPLKLSLDDLKKKFKVHTITASVQCAGNRRTEMSAVKLVKGLSWGTTAISNATWTGVKLSDVLNYAGAKEDDCEHVIFQGLDKDVSAEAYEASVPSETAFDPRKDVLLAFEMNGKELPLDHGYPLRAVVPGTVGARQVKWLNKVVISKEESKGHWQQNDYKSFHPSIDWNTVDFSKSKAIQEYPIQSAICEPADGSTVEGSEVTVKGYAWSGGGRGIVRVDLSIDGGKTWQLAELHKEEQKRHREWAWTLWEATVPIPEKAKKLEIVAKAVDTSHNTQPETPVGIWNLRGLINNAWHRVHVKVDK